MERKTPAVTTPQAAIQQTDNAAKKVVEYETIVKNIENINDKTIKTKVSEAVKSVPNNLHDLVDYANSIISSGEADR